MTESLLGMVGLGVIGRNMLLNMADHGSPVAGYDRDRTRVDLVNSEAGSRPMRAARTMAEFVEMLRQPRTVMILVPAGRPVDVVIRELVTHLSPGDLIIDGGNSHFGDTNLRAAALRERGIMFLGVGISGGEEGARRGPSIMPGGPPEAYERVRGIYEAVAAQVDGEPCVTYIGPGSAGHYVKMVHNGIEYAILRLIAETYDLMKRGLGLADAELSGVYERWDRGQLNAYLIEITARILRQIDPHTGRPLVELILDEAGQKGTGRWASEDAMDLQVPMPTVDAAIAMRHLSILKQEREAASRTLAGPAPSLAVDKQAFVDRVGDALYAGMIVSYAQGMALLRAASRAYSYNLKLEDIARIWRGGCIIRSAMLQDIRSAFRTQPDLLNLLLDTNLGQQLNRRQDDLRAVVQAAAGAGIAAPAFMTALAYYDGYRSAWLPESLIQAQRDYFGAHTYERVDAKGVFHTEWETD